MERNTDQKPGVIVCREWSGLWLTLMRLQLVRCLCRSQVARHSTGTGGYSNTLVLCDLLTLSPASPCNNLFISTERRFITQQDEMVTELAMETPPHV